MNEMVERVARSILKTELSHKFGYDEDVQKRIDEEWHWWVEEARAAIEAMRVPTGHMAHVAAQFSCFEGRYDEAQAPVDVWQAMIDEALRAPVHTPKGS